MKAQEANGLLAHFQVLRCLTEALTYDVLRRMADQDTDETADESRVVVTSIWKDRIVQAVDTADEYLDESFICKSIAKDEVDFERQCIAQRIDAADFRANAAETKLLSAEQDRPRELTTFSDLLSPLVDEIDSMLRIDVTHAERRGQLKLLQAHVRAIKQKIRSWDDLPL